MTSEALSKEIQREVESYYDGLVSLASSKGYAFEDVMIAHLEHWGIQDFTDDGLVEHVQMAYPELADEIWGQE